MADALMIVPLDAAGIPNLPIDAEAGETLEYASGTKVRERNEWERNQSTDAIPEGYHTILATIPLYNDADTPVITGYDIHARLTETVPRMFGGYVMLAPAHGGLPLALVLIESTQAMLDTLNTRLRTIVIVSTSNFYGRVPLTATAAIRNNIADKLDELAADLLIPKPRVSADLTQAAIEVRAIVLAGWKAAFYDVLATLFQIPSRFVIQSLSIGVPTP